MADFNTKAALLDKTAVGTTVTLDTADVAVPTTDYVATGSGTNSSLQGFEQARSQFVEWFIDCTIADADQLSIIVQTSDDAATWFDLDEESLILDDGTEGVSVADFNGRSIRMVVPVGSRQNRFMRLSFVSSDSTPDASFEVSARVAGVYKIFTKG
jgi:hypothetical protein